MAQVIPDILVPSDEYISLNGESGIPVGSGFLLQLKGSTPLRLIESASKPLPTDTSGQILEDLGEVLKDSLEVWALNIANPAIGSVQHTSLNVQTV